MTTMSPDQWFVSANLLAMTGWLVLVAGIWSGAARLRDQIAGLLVPAILALGYTVIVLTHFASSEGGFDTLANVERLFQSRWSLLAGWVHYLAFDLMVGAHISRDAAERRLPRWLVTACLPFVFLFGPAGWLAWLVTRSVYPKQRP